ncbi:tetratricopeptide repeat protein [Citrobacter freundii]|uniref:tetratricopeptide repeat protein n=1 Tax=Citrobacter freundii TaxID=546 RepID=UPI002F967105
MINKTIWKCICQVQLKHTHTMFIAIIKVIFTGKEKLRTIIYCPHVYQLKQDYKHALDIYAIAYALDDDNLRAIFEAGQCYMHLHNYSKARDSFGEVVAHEKDPELVKRAEVYLKALTKINDSDEDHYHVRNSK